jgi:very-short-patch-repair endonuclease
LVVEVDGPVHDTEREYDLERDMILGEMGPRVLIFANSAVLKDPAAMAKSILSEYIRPKE